MLDGPRAETMQDLAFAGVTGTHVRALLGRRRRGLRGVRCGVLAQLRHDHGPHTEREHEQKAHEQEPFAPLGTVLRLGHPKT